MTLHFRSTPRVDGAVELRRKIPAVLKRTPTFATLLRKEVLGLRSFDPMFRYSLTRLPEEEGSEEPRIKKGSAKAVDGGSGNEGKSGIQWANVRSAVERVVWHCFEEEETHRGGGCPLADGELSALHSDVRVLIRSEAGVFIFEYLKDKLLPAAAAKVLQEIERKSRVEGTPGSPKRKTPPPGRGAGSREHVEVGDDVIDTLKLCEALSSAWERFYSYSLTLLEAIFYQVKSRNLSIRQAGLITFRDYIVLPLKPELEMLLEGYKPAGEKYKGSKNEVPPVIKQMLLVLQGVNESCPPSGERLKLENLVARAITPYLGFRGLYEGGNSEPTKPSQELAVIHKRRPSVVDPRHLSRPLSVVGTGRIETLSELFTLSADRICHKKTSNRNTAHHDL